MTRHFQAGLQAALGALAGAIAYLVQVALIHPGNAHLASPAAIPFALYIALWALPPAICTILLVRFAARWGWWASACASALAVAVSYPCFAWYMQKLSPLLAWERAWLLPVTTASVTALLFWLDRPRAERGLG